MKFFRAEKTNPVEKIISSSAEILSYINERNAIAIVATHEGIKSKVSLKMSMSFITLAKI